MLKSGCKNYGKAQDMVTFSTQNASDENQKLRQSVLQFQEHDLALWRPQKSKSMNQRSFEEKKKHADGKSSSFIGSFIWGDNTTKTNETSFKENLVSFENLVKDCQVDLVEWADCIINKD